jgi:putative phosphoesterase
MTTRIGLLSDIHATAAPLREALAIFAREEVDMLLCPGDIAGYGEELEAVVELLWQVDCQYVRGNHERWAIGREDIRGDILAWLVGLPLQREYVIEGMNIYMVHASPPDSDMDGIKLLDENGELIPQEVDYWRGRLKGFAYDILLVGHTHQAYAEQLDDTLVINPGSTAFNHSCAILHLPERRVEWFGVGGEISRAWNWGDLVRGA